jgi:hypothetical protein
MLKYLGSIIYNYWYPNLSTSINIEKDVTLNEFNKIASLLRDNYKENGIDLYDKKGIAFTGLKYECNKIIEKLNIEQENEYTNARIWIYTNFINALNEKDITEGSNFIKTILGAEYDKLVEIYKQIKSHPTVYHLSIIPLWILLQIDLCLIKKYDSKIYFANYVDI